MVQFGKITRLLSRIILLTMGGIVLLFYQNCSPIGQVGGFDPTLYDGSSIDQLGGNGMGPADGSQSNNIDPLTVPGSNEFCAAYSLSAPKITNIIVSGKSIPLTDVSNASIALDQPLYVGMDIGNSYAGIGNDLNVPIYIEYQKSQYVSEKSVYSSGLVTVDSNNLIDLNLNNDMTSLRLRVDVGNNNERECRSGSADVVVRISDAACYNNNSNTQGRTVRFKVNYINNCVTTKKLTPASAQVDDQYGYDVDVDGNQMIVANFNLNGSVANQGAGIVYTRSGNDWTNPQTLYPSDGIKDQNVTSVGIDGNLAVIGSTFAASLPTEGRTHGRAYVFKNNAGTWTPIATLNPGIGTGDANRLLNRPALFGQSVAVDGNTIVVSAVHHDNDTGYKQGKVYVYNFDGSNVNLVQTLTGSQQNEYEFGYDLALTNGTLVVSEPVLGSAASSLAGKQTGKVYVYTLSGQTFGSPEVLQPPTGVDQDGMRFGQSVDTNGTKVVVGAYKQDNGGDDRGMAFVCGLAAGSCAKLPNPKVNANQNYFGRGVAISPNGQNIFIGAPGANGTTSEDYGLVFQYVGSSSYTEYRVYRPLRADNQSENSLGEAIAATDTYFAAGARGHVISSDRNGSVFVFNHQENNDPSK
ncbi:MAG: FG-GAP repeat protein [Bdellovibrionales bacterium]|nr:FG-GAP repeat protein [Bdellovibrionales bacterium]